METGYLFSGKLSQQTERRKSGYYCLRRLSFARPPKIDKDSGPSLPGGTPWSSTAKQFEGWRINYTPVADDSLIRVTCGGYISSPSAWLDLAVGSRANNSVYIGGPSNSEFWSWDVPSWGAGISEKLAIQCGGGGSLNEGGTSTSDYGGSIDNRLRTFVVEEWENTEPGKPAVMIWDAGNIDF